MQDCAAFFQLPEQGGPAEANRQFQVIARAQGSDAELAAKSEENAAGAAGNGGFCAFFFQEEIGAAQRKGGKPAQVAQRIKRSAAPGSNVLNADIGPRLELVYIIALIGELRPALVRYNDCERSQFPVLFPEAAGRDSDDRRRIQTAAQRGGHWMISIQPALHSFE